MNKIGVDIDPLICPRCGQSKYRYAKTCRQCYNVQGKNNPNYKHGQSTTPHSQSPFLWIVLERGAACERCGCIVKAALEIHHKDRNPANNDDDNLELLCANCHKQEHLGITRRRLWKKIDKIRTVLNAEPEHIILDEWMEHYYGLDQPAVRRVRTRCSGCGCIREIFMNGFKKGKGFCNTCAQIRRAYADISIQGGKTHGDE